MTTQTEDEHKEKVDTGTQHDIKNYDNKSLKKLTEEATREAEYQ